MNDSIDKLIEEVRAHVDDGSSELMQEIANALDRQAMEIHELREANQVLAGKVREVRQLAWTDTECPEAKTPFGVYDIFETVTHEWAIEFTVLGAEHRSDFNKLPTLRGAKQWAQDNYTLRVLECLMP